MSYLWLHCGRVTGLSLHCLQVSHEFSIQLAQGHPRMFLILSVTHRDRDLPTGLGWAEEAAGGKYANNLAVKRDITGKRCPYTHEPQSRGEGRYTMGFPHIPLNAEITQQHRVSEVAGLHPCHMLAQIW